MRVDNRVFIPFLGPFVALFAIRAVFWAAGAPWSVPEAGAVVSLFLGVIGGAALMTAMFDTGITIGHITIGKGKSDD